MRILLAVIILAAAGWAGYWFIGAQSVESAVRTWLDARRSEGWVVSYADVNTAGFPNRFDTTIGELELADPESGLAWSAPFFQVLALSYRPSHVIAVWPHTQTVSTPYQSTTLTSQNMRASVNFDNTRELTLERGVLEFDTVGLASDADWRATLDHGQLALRQTPLETNTYDVSFEASNLSLPDTLSETRDGETADNIERIVLDAMLTFDAPWDRRAIEQRRPQPQRIRIDEASVKWDDLNLDIAGDVTIDGEGLASGEITVRARNWREILRLAKSSDLLPEQVFPLIEGGLRTIAKMSGNPDTIDAPLTLKDGRITVGGVIPLGRVPRLVLR